MTYTVKIERNDEPEYKRWSASIDWRPPQGINRIQADFDDDRLTTVLRQVAEAIAVEEEAQFVVKTSAAIMTPEEAFAIVQANDAQRKKNRRSK